MQFLIPDSVRELQLQDSLQEKSWMNFIWYKADASTDPVSQFYRIWFHDFEPENEWNIALWPNTSLKATTAGLWWPILEDNWPFESSDWSTIFVNAFGQIWDGEVVLDLKEKVSLLKWFLLSAESSHAYITRWD